MLTSSAIAHTLTRSTPPELRLVLACMRTYFGTLPGTTTGGAEPSAQDLEAITAELSESHGFEWTQFVAYAAAHRTTPLVSQVLNETGRDLVPDNILKHLKGSAQSTATRNLSLSSQLLTILKGLDEKGLQAIPIKGPSLAVCAYKNLALRQFSDLDILVRKGDALATRDLLVELGYISVYDYDREAEEKQLNSSYFKGYTYGHPQHKTIVDLHWKLLQKYLSLPLDYDKLWERAMPFSFCGNQMLRLSPVDDLLFICIHGSRDRWISLRLISDVAAIVMSQSIDWSVLLASAKRLGCQHRLFLGLALAQWVLNVDLPDMVQREISTFPAVRRLAEKVCRQLFEPTSRHLTLVQRGFFDLRVRERWQDKMQYGLYQPLLLAARRDGLAPSFV